MVLIIVMRNSGKEKTITEPLIRRWAKRIGMDLSVVDTAAVYNPYAKRYLRAQASESLPDLIGNYFSLSVWIELKSPKLRRSILQNQQQVDFLIRKINQGCFACVTDSVEHLETIWTNYWKTPSENRIQFLLDDIPKRKTTPL
jgi:hypothetical protein